MNLNSQIDWSDTDRIVSNDTRYVSLNGERQTTIAYDSFGRIATMQVSTPEEENHHSTNHGVKFDKVGINCLGCAIGVDAAVDPWRNSLDHVLSRQGFSGTVIPDTECKCEECDDILVYVYVYINKYAIDRQDFASYAERHRQQYPDIFGATGYWNTLPCLPPVDFHAIRKDCKSGGDTWVYVDKYYQDRNGRDWLPNIMEGDSYFPNKDQVISGKCFRKRRK